MEPSEWTDGRLQRLFERYNRRFWAGKLPVFTVRVGVPANPDFAGWCDSRKKEITVDATYLVIDRQVRSALLHEMCHAALGDRHLHDRRFYAEIDRLRRLKAPVECRSEERRFKRWAMTGRWWYER